MINRRRHPVWQNEKYVAELQRSLAAAIISTGDGRSSVFKKVWDAVEGRLSALTPEDGDLADQKGFSEMTFYRFAKFIATPDQGLMLDAIADTVEQLLTSDANKDSKQINRAHFSEDLQNARKNKISGEKDNGHETQAVSTDPTLLNILRVDSVCFQAAAELLTGQKTVLSHADRDRVAAHYFSYRYSSHTGQVVRSAFTFLPPTDQEPECRFTHKLVGPDDSRRFADGIAYISGECLYLVGSFNGIPGLKVAAFVHEGGRKPPYLSGVTLSRGKAPLVSRLVLERSNQPIEWKDIFTKEEAFNPVFKSEAYLKQVFPKIKNECSFLLGNDIIFSQNEPSGNESISRKALMDQGAKVLSQQAMVTKVGELLAGKFWLANHNDSDAVNAFNPAAHSEYPFNQAVKVAGT